MEMKKKKGPTIDEILEQNLELQKQVDELKIKTCPNSDYCGGRIQQAVKDTAKEILQRLWNEMGEYTLIGKSKFERHLTEIEEIYGVEVE